MILSVSRRTDIPAYYSEWFINRLRAGYVLTRNPMNPSQISRINLSPEVIDCIVFWTKDPAPLMDRLSIIDAMGYKYYLQFTLTPYEKELERNLRDKKDIIHTFLHLSEKIGRERVLWRYDPIILNDEITPDYHREQFESLCAQLKQYTKICTISFVDLYTKVMKTVNKANLQSASLGSGKSLIREITESEMLKLAAIFSETAAKYGIELRACSEQMDLRKYGIRPAGCIDRKIIEKVCGYSIDVKADANQRPGCGCIQSIDIGVYNTCKNGCIYCYANYSDASVEKNYKSHKPDSDILIGTVRPEEKIKTREMKLQRNDQLSLNL